MLVFVEGGKLEYLEKNPWSKARTSSRLNPESNFWDFYLSKWGGTLVFLGNLGKKDTSKHDIKDDFLRELIEFWVDFNFRDSFLSKHDFCSSVIWNYSLVGIELGGHWLRSSTPTATTKFLTSHLGYPEGRVELRMGSAEKSKLADVMIK